MCEGVSGLVISTIFMFIGFAAVLTGTGLPLWQSGRGVGIGLFYTCIDWDCSSVEFSKDTQYITAILILLGIVFLAVSVGTATHVCMNRCQGQKLNSFLPGFTCMLMVIGDTLLLTGSIIYCANVYTDEEGFSLDASPWLVISGGLVCGISSYFLQRITNSVSRKVHAEEPPKTLKQNPVAIPREKQRRGNLARLQLQKLQAHQENIRQQKAQEKQPLQRHEPASIGVKGEPQPTQELYQKFSTPTAKLAPTPDSLAYYQDVYSIHQRDQPFPVHEPLTYSYGPLEPPYPYRDPNDIDEPTGNKT